MTDDISTLPVRPTGLDDLRDLVGRDIGPTDWVTVTQELVNAFAEVTDDHQWIHVDPERAATSPLGTTIAHGLLVLSLGPGLSYKLMSFDGFAHGLNYGYDKVRFVSPLPVGSRIRMRMQVLGAEAAGGGIKIRTLQTFEREGQEKPVAVAESLARVVA
ncbi:MAG: MaoC family dehydratase [Rhodococcus ruber]|nr:MaoC family dehydratase [Rhodococcus ruber]